MKVNENKSIKDMVFELQTICFATECKKKCDLLRDFGECPFGQQGIKPPYRWKFERPKTCLEVFREAFPNAVFSDAGLPHACVRDMFGKQMDCPMQCTECWNQPAPKEHQKIQHQTIPGRKRGLL